VTDAPGKLWGQVSTAPIVSSRLQPPASSAALEVSVKPSSAINHSVWATVEDNAHSAALSATH